MIKQKIIIDTDPGVDDAFAIMMAVSEPSLDILALTTTCGNVGIDVTTHNALGLKKLLKLDVPVYKGAYKPLTIPFMDASDVHGKSGLGNYRFESVSELTSQENAWDAIYRIAKANQKITIIALGPLTNIAIALMRYPDLPDYIEKVVSMGGTTGYGNVTPYSEFNYWCDPLAAKLVLESDLNVYMVGLNATRQTLMTQEELDTLDPKNPDIHEFVSLEKMFYSEILKKRGLKGFHLPDAVAVAATIDPSMINYEEKPVKVITDNGIKQGWTLVDLRKMVDTNLKVVNVALRVNKNRYLELLQGINTLLEDTQ